MDNLIYKDYAAWKLENHEIIEVFHDNHSVVYDRLEPVYSVLNHIYDTLIEEKELSEELETIFIAGFNYLNTQLETIKIYYDTLFKSDCDEFLEYSEMVLYLLYIYDIKSDMENNNLDSDIKELNELEESIENLIMDRGNDFDYIKNQMNETLKTVFNEIEYEYISIVDIFVEIGENLGIFLYEDEDLVIGRDL